MHPARARWSGATGSIHSPLRGTSCSRRIRQPGASFAPNGVLALRARKAMTSSSISELGLIQRRKAQVSRRFCQLMRNGRKNLAGRGAWRRILLSRLARATPPQRWYPARWLSEPAHHQVQAPSRLSMPTVPITGICRSLTMISEMVWSRRLTRRQPVFGVRSSSIWQRWYSPVRPL